MKLIVAVISLILLFPHFGVAKEGFHYISYGEMEKMLEEMHEKYGRIMYFYSIGKTYGGRDIWAVKISDNVSIDENEAEVLFLAAHHGNEKPGYQFLLSFIKYLCENYSRNESIAFIINNAEIFLIPMVNPDGVENNTRKNMKPNGAFLEKIFPVMRGVNLNRNYDVGWDKWKPWYFTSTTVTPYGDLLLYFMGYPPEYRGIEPFSEKETRAVRDFIKERNILIAADYHTGAGKVIFYPFGYTNAPPPDEKTFVSIAENISRINGYSFQEAGVGVTGMAMDWMYERHGIYAFVVEVSGEIAPSDVEKMKKIVRENMPVNIYLIERAIEMWAAEERV